MERATAARAIAHFLLENADHRPDLISTAPLLRPVDVSSRAWDVWLTDGGRPGSSSYVGPLDESRVVAALDARNRLEHRDPRRRGADLELDRSHLVALSERAAKSNERRCVALWVAAMMWSAGTIDTRAPWRTAQGLAHDGLGAALRASHASLRHGDIAGAYDTASSIFGTGESSFTKWLWAASLGLPAIEPPPLILDRHVRSALWSADVRPANNAQGYIDYVEAMHDAAVMLRKEHGLRGATAEKLEWLLSRSRP